MSRSNPQDNTPNPSTRWFEFSGETGGIRYFDKNAKNLKDPDKKGENIPVPIPFTFILLDELSSVAGWHDASESGIYSNEVRDTRAETLVVKSFKGGILAEGFYNQIRDRVGNFGGYFRSNNYVGYKDAAGLLKIGAIQFKGSALNAWVEFRKAHRVEIYKKAVKITGYVEGKKGKIVFRTPVFAIADITDKTDAEAKALDMLLQQYLKGYFSRTKSQQVAQPTPDAAVQEDAPPETNQEPPVCPQCQGALNSVGECQACLDAANSDVPF